MFLLLSLGGFVRADQVEVKASELIKETTEKAVEEKGIEKKSAATVVSDKHETSPPSASLSILKPKKVAANSNIGSESEWPFVVFTLVAIIGLILGLGWLAKRFGGLNAMGMRDMKVVSAIPVGAREKVALLDVGGTQILIGITSQNINHLHTFETAVIDTASNKKPSDVSLKKPSDFALKLQALIGDKRESKHAES